MSFGNSLGTNHETMNEVDKIAYILTLDGKILSTRTKGRDKFYIPGGKREYDETDEQTLVREVKEELNVDIIIDSIAYIGTFKAQSDGATKGVIVKMTCYTANYDGCLKANSEIEEIRWLDSSNLNIISEVDKKIFAFLNATGLIH
jgi:8-oxo-dGTP pyrophosphatase MutT (NUDIX family)